MRMLGALAGATTSAGTAGEAGGEIASGRGDRVKTTAKVIHCSWPFPSTSLTALGTRGRPAQGFSNWSNVAEASRYLAQWFDCLDWSVVKATQKLRSIPVQYRPSYPHGAQSSRTAPPGKTLHSNPASLVSPHLIHYRLLTDNKADRKRKKLGGGGSAHRPQSKLKTFFFTPSSEE